MTRLAALLLLVILAAACGGSDDGPKQLQVARYAIESDLVGRRLDQIALEPAGGGDGRPVLVLLHGAGSRPDMFVDETVLGAIRALGDDAPLVVLPDGGGTSYFHDRQEGRWGTYILDEVIPEAGERFGADTERVAIGGISMGGFGALDLGRLFPDRFCAVAGHSPAVFRSIFEAPSVAFDDTTDFARHDLMTIIGEASASPYGQARVWIDVGRQDPLLAAATTYGAMLRARGTDVEVHVWPGGHDGQYWGGHIRDYFDFYADALENC